MRENAKGNRPQASREHTKEDEHTLFRLGKFGASSSEALQRTVWCLVSLHFGFRARDESRLLKRGDVKLCGDPENNDQFLLWQCKRGSKTRNGNDQQRAFYTVAEAINGKRCPVQFYKMFIRRRPDALKILKRRFFLPLIIKESQKIPFNFKSLLWVKIKLVNFSQKRRKTQQLRVTLAIIASEKLLFLG